MTFLKMISLSALFLTSSAWAQTSLDWDQLNATFVDIVQEHVDTFDFLESGSIVVDKTKSDLAAGSLSLGFNFMSTELNLLSSNQPQTIGLLGQLDIQTIDLGTLKRVDFEGSISLRSNTLVVLKHLNQLFTDCSSVDPADTFQVEICKYVAGVENAKSAVELKDAIEAFRQALLTLFPSSVGSDDEFHKILSELNIVEQIDSVLVSAIVSNLELFGLSLSADLSLTFADDSITVQAIGSTILENADYQNFINGTENILVGLQTQDQNTTDMVYNYTFLVFDLLEGIFF